MPNPTPPTPHPKDDTTPTTPTDAATTDTTTAAPAAPAAPGAATPDIAAGRETTAPTPTASDPETANGSAGGGPGARRTRAGELEDRVWAALRHHPGATAAELASEASASRSAVGKLLAAWAADGSATSTPGAKPRDARRWTAAPTHPTTRAERVTDPDTATPDTATPDHASATNVAEADSSAADTSAADAGADTAEAAVTATTSDGDVSSDRDAIDGGTPRAGTAQRGKAREGDDARAGDSDRRQPQTTAPSRREASHEVRPDSSRPPTSPAASPSSRNRSGSTRLPKGGLRGQVEDYLADTAGEHSPVEIGKVLGRSSGAIANALEALVEAGDAVRTLERPRRYSHPDHADAVDHTGRGDAGDRAPADADADGGRARVRGPGRGVCGVGTYVTVLAVLPLDSIDAISTDEIAERVRTQMPAPVLFAAAAHGVTRAALSAGAEPSDWPTPTTADATTADAATVDGAADATAVIPAETAAEPDAASTCRPVGSDTQPDGADAADPGVDEAAAATTDTGPPSGATIGRGDAETGDGSGRENHRVDSHPAAGGDHPARAAEPGRPEAISDSGSES